MDLITYALALASNPEPVDVSKITPSIGENGNWFIGDKDTGVSAVKSSNVDVDGVLVADTEDQEIFVLKDGVKTVVGDATSSIDVKEIGTLFLGGSE